MLPKAERRKKKVEAEQMPLLPTKPVDDQLQQKRWVVAIFLILTVGTSLGLLIYKNHKSFGINFNFKLPSIPKLTDLKIDGTTGPIDQIVADNQNIWSIKIKVNGQPYFQKNEEYVTLIPTGELTIAKSDLITGVLPAVAIVKEKIIAETNFYEYHALISVPKNEIVVAIKFAGSHNRDESILLVPKIVEKVYWGVMGK